MNALHETVHRANVKSATSILYVRYVEHNYLEYFKFSVVTRQRFLSFANCASRAVL